MRPAIGSVRSLRVGRNRLPTMRVVGTQVGLDDACPRRVLDGGKVLRRGLFLLVGHPLGQVDHRVGVRLARIGGVSQAVSEILNLAHEVRDGQSAGRRVFRPALTVRQMARAAAAFQLAQSGRTVRDEVGHGVG